MFCGIIVPYHYFSSIQEAPYNKTSGFLIGPLISRKSAHVLGECLCYSHSQCVDSTRTGVAQRLPLLLFSNDWSKNRDTGFNAHAYTASAAHCQSQLVTRGHNKKKPENASQNGKNGRSMHSLEARTISTSAKFDQRLRLRFSKIIDRKGPACYFVWFNYMIVKGFSYFSHWISTLNIYLLFIRKSILVMIIMA